MEFDAAIVGSSTAGLYAASLLSEEGKRIAVFEREKQIDPERRIYIITPGINRVWDSYPDSLILNKIQNIEISGNQTKKLISLNAPDLIMERKMITNILFERAKAAGVQFFPNMEFKKFGPDKNNSYLVFLDENDREQIIKASIVIGADGVKSQVRSQAGISDPPIVPLLQVEVMLPPDWKHDTTHVWFDRSRTKYFFWLIPESNNRAVVGLIDENDGEIKKSLNSFLEKFSFELIDIQRGAVTLHHPSFEPWANVGDCRVMLIGDAAGQVKVTTVGGTVTGLWGARAAVEAIINGRSYEETYQPLKNELDLHWWIRGMLNQLDQVGYEKLIQLVSPKVHKFLAENDRDGMKNNFWKLAFIQPRYIPLGINTIISSVIK